MGLKIVGFVHILKHVCLDAQKRNRCSVCVSVCVCVREREREREREEANPCVRLCVVPVMFVSKAHTRTRDENTLFMCVFACVYMCVFVCVCV